METRALIRGSCQELSWQPSPGIRFAGTADSLWRVQDSVQGRGAVPLGGRGQAAVCCGGLDQHRVGHGAGLTVGHWKTGCGAAVDSAAAQSPRGTG